MRIGKLGPRLHMKQVIALVLFQAALHGLGVSCSPRTEEEAGFALKHRLQINRTRNTRGCL